MIAQQCNLNCYYCYGNGGEYQNKGKMSLEVGRDAIDYLVRKCGNRKHVYITFFGGEPLLNVELIYDLIDYMESIERTTEIHFVKSMTTNGTLLTESIINYCIEKRISIKISIDGHEEINEIISIIDSLKRNRILIIVTHDDKFYNSCDYALNIDTM